MKVRLLFLVLGLLLCTSLAFAGPQISIADPGCQTGDISLTANTFSFTFDSGHPVMHFCNNSGNDWSSLNFTIALPNAIDLAGIYCGGPEPSETGDSAAFDYCMVLDPSQPVVEGSNPHGYPIDSKLIHEFDVANGDTPSSFFSDDSCYFGCPNQPSDLKNLVQLSFNLLPNNESEFAVMALDDVDPCAHSFPQGLMSGCQFTIALDCPPNIATCDASQWDGAVFGGLASTNVNTLDFPAPVPEPATIALLSTGALAGLRRVKRNRAGSRGQQRK